MQSHRQTFRRMNLDADPMSLRADEYTYLLNGVLTPTESGHNQSVGSINGNQVLANLDPPGGTVKCIGRIKDLAGQRLFFFLQSSNGNHTIYQVNSALVIDTVLRWSGFNWTSGLVVDGFVVGDLLYFTDQQNIWRINVTTAMAGDYTPLEEEISLIRRPPQLPLTGVVEHDAGYADNHVSDHYFQFAYRYIYDDDEESVLSAVSDIVTLPFSPTFNRITVSIQAGETIPITVKRIDFAFRIDGGTTWSIYHSEFPVAGVLGTLDHYFFNDTFRETIPDSVSVKWNDSIPLSATSIGFVRNRLFTLNNLEGRDVPSEPIAGMTATAVTYGGDYSFKRRGVYGTSLLFFDYAGRFDAVRVPEQGTVTIPDRSFSTTSLDRYKIQVSLAGIAQADIPLWATHYAVLRSKIQNISWFVSTQAADIFYRYEASDGTITYGKTYAQAGTKDLILDIKGLTELNMGYTWQDGDRVRIFGQDTFTPDFPSEPYDAPIKSQEGRFIVIDSVEVTLAGAGSSDVTIEIYRPTPLSSTAQYECGKKYAITNPGGGSRALSVTSVDLTGDVYVHARNTYQYATSGYDATDPFGCVFELAASISQFEMMNASDRYFDVWAGDAVWRSVIPLPDGSAQRTKAGYIRFSQPYFQGSQINGLSTFEALDEYPIPINSGSGTALVAVDNVLVSLMHNDSIALYIGEGFISTSDANSFLAKTDQVIGSDRQYFGGYGTKHKESVANYGGRIYYFDILRGAIIRRSQDGLTNLSELYGVDRFIKSYARDHVAEAGGAVRFIGGYDPTHEMYLLTAVFNGTIDWTLGFHEPTNSFVGFFDYQPEMYADFMEQLITFKDGDAWIHNFATRLLLYGVAKQRKQEFAVSVLRSKVNIWQALAIDADDFYEDSGSNDTVVDITNDGQGFLTAGSGDQHTTIRYMDLKLREGVWRSSIFMDLNTLATFIPAARARFDGNPMRGQVIRVQIFANRDDSPAYLRSVEILYRASEFSQV